MGVDHEWPAAGLGGGAGVGHHGVLEGGEVGRQPLQPPVLHLGRGGPAPPLGGGAAENFFKKNTT